MFLSSLSGSAAERPTPKMMEQWRRRMSPPDNEFPAGLTVLLARSDVAAIGITQISVFSTGFQFSLSVRVREVRPHRVPGELHMLTSSHGPPGVDIPVADRLLLGLEYSDGRRASTLEERWMRGPGEGIDEQRLVLVQNGGGGGERSMDHTYWVSPLPPAGPVTFVVAWQSFGIPESETVVDGTAIRAAAERSQQLWPPQPIRRPSKPPPPPRPSSGWFAES